MQQDKTLKKGEVCSRIKQVKGNQTENVRVM